MSRKIVVVVDSIDINDSSGSKANVALIKNLIAIGYEVFVYHYTRKKIKLHRAHCHAIKEKKRNILYILSRTQRIIQRVLKINLAKYLEPIFGFSFTFLNDVNSIKAALKKVDIIKVDLVLTLSKAASFRPHYAVNKIPNFYDKWMAYIHDPYPFSCYPEPYDWREPGYKKKERFFKYLSNRAKYSAFPSLLLKEWMGKFFLNFLNTGIVIPHQNIDVDLKTQVAPDFFDSDKFNILHAGSLMKQRNPKGLIKGFQLFLDNNPSAKQDSNLLLLGCADYHEKMINNYVKEMPELYVDLSNVSFKEVFWLQKHVAINVILEAESEFSPFLPGKFPHCVSANKPILYLGPQRSEVKRLLGEVYPYWTRVNNIAAIAEILQQLYNEWLIDKGILVLNSPDLGNYLGKEYLKEQLENVLNND